MNHRLFQRKFFVLAGAALSCASGATPAAADALTVVELYQSQGCSSCPPANEILNQLAGYANILPLSFAVTYWDRLGWKDSFADPAYTARQWDYAKTGGRGNVATPQFIVNGRGVVTGSSLQQLALSIRTEGRPAHGPVIRSGGGKIRVGAARTGVPATVWLVRYDPATRNVRISRGENGGRVLPHRNVVTGLRRLGSWTGSAVAFQEPAYRRTSERSAVLVQQGPGGRIIAAAKL